MTLYIRASGGLTLGLAGQGLVVYGRTRVVEKTWSTNGNFQTLKGINQQKNEGCLIISAFPSSATKTDLTRIDDENQIKQQKLKTLLVGNPLYQSATQKFPLVD